MLAPQGTTKSAEDPVWAPPDSIGTVTNGEEQLPYRAWDNFLSAAEVSFFHLLRRTVGDRYYFAPKVRISDLLYVVQRRSNAKHANRIDRKHVDFVLCDPQTMQPRLVIELHDSSHARTDRMNRDELVDAAFASAEIPILHIRAKRSYSPEELRKERGDALAGEKSKPPRLPSTASDGSSIPACPKCRIPMVERKASRGAHKGNRFWGCPSYPDCREIISID